MKVKNDSPLDRICQGAMAHPPMRAWKPRNQRERRGRGVKVVRTENSCPRLMLKYCAERG